MTTTLYSRGGVSAADARDAVDYLRRRGFGELVDALSDPEVYAATSGLPDRRRLSRRLGVSAAEADRILSGARIVLEGQQ